jgi:hypothetical protein
LLYVAEFQFRYNYRENVHIYSVRPQHVAEAAQEKGLTRGVLSKMTTKTDPAEEAGQAQLTERIKEVAATRVRYGHRRCAGRLASECQAAGGPPTGDTIQ